LHWTFNQRVKQHRRACRVDLRITLDFIHALADADGCGKMKNRVNALQGAPYRDWIADIAFDQFNVGIEILGTPEP
jgi:hypothetical protein